MSDWLADLAPRAGPLTAAAQRFLSTHPGAPPAFSPDAAGIRALADAIDAWVERDGEEDDDAFIEGAGAALAMLVLALQPGSHRAQGGAHRLELGEGCFDPFAAIEAAMDAEDGARRSLAASLAGAREEAVGQSGIGRVRRLLREALGRERPELQVESAFDRVVTLSGGIEIDLTRVLATTSDGSDDDVLRAIGKLVTMLPGGRADADPDEQENLLPRLVAPGFGAQVGVPLALRSIVGGALELAFVIAHTDRARYVRLDELAAWRLGLDDATELAVRNLANRSGRARLLRVDDQEGSLLLMRSGDGLDAARLLLPAMHEVLSEQLGSPLLVAVPHRDALWAAALSARDALRRRAQKEAQRAPHRISEALFSLASATLSTLD